MYIQIGKSTWNFEQGGDGWNCFSQRSRHGCCTKFCDSSDFVTAFFFAAADFPHLFNEQWGKEEEQVHKRRELPRCESEFGLWNLSNINTLLESLKNLLILNLWTFWKKNESENELKVKESWNQSWKRFRHKRMVQTFTHVNSVQENQIQLKNQTEQIYLHKQNY